MRIICLLLLCAAIFSCASDPSRLHQTETMSPQAQRFLKQSTPPVFESPLTAATVSPIREGQRAASEAEREHLRKTLMSSMRWETIGGVPVAVLTPKTIAAENKGRAALYLHGGGFTLGIPDDAYAMRLAALLQFPVYGVQYRLAPEHPFPAALDDCLTVYAKLVASHDPHNVVVFGGSAGGNLALAMLIKANTAGLPMPAALGLSSPAADLTRTGDSPFANQGRDPVLQWDGLMEYFALAYTGDDNPGDPLLSPVYADYWPGFPPTLITTGTRDLFLSGCVRLSRALRLAGAQVKLLVWENMFHGFDLIPDLPEGQEAREEMALFLLGGGEQ
ncbi:alpha/beta hydrolase [Desulfatitalea alkaliphila]|uniref:Alpha/beta hydrolase n=1 Tax=Desulfatitalea alkaliphila TaxID=2929485 RepID=A0AA41R0K1_9BACT|nr:alpha/beta hydrolase [Desulfatitalea alkaliphila]MCJ8499743.1 alpha/beta hydrolase [Desulfatitalea alkaliphila]